MRPLRVTLPDCSRYNSLPAPWLAHRPLPDEGMVDLKLQVPVTDKFEVNAETLTAIDRGIEGC